MPIINNDYNIASIILLEIRQKLLMMSGVSRVPFDYSRQLTNKHSAQLTSRLSSQ
jgi:hypothetical protein